MTDVDKMESMCSEMEKRNKDCEMSQDDVAHLIATIRDLCTARENEVHQAYNEGFIEGTKEHTTNAGGKTWQESKSCKNLNLGQSRTVI